MKVLSFFHSKKSKLSARKSTYVNINRPTVFATPFARTEKEDPIQFIMRYYKNDPLSFYRETNALLYTGGEIPESNLQKNKSTQEDVLSLLRIFPSSRTVFNDLLGYCQEHPTAIHEEGLRRIVLSLILHRGPLQISPDGSELHQIAALEEWLSRIGFSIKGRRRANIHVPISNACSSLFAFKGAC